jgi:hypothetical protein
VNNKPGTIGQLSPEKFTPWGNQRYIVSPTILPRAAPILKTGTKFPEGTGSVEATMERKN